MYFSDNVHVIIHKIKNEEVNFNIFYNVNVISHKIKSEEVNFKFLKSDNA